MDWMNYHHLYYFKVIAEEESVSKAAAKLRLGQPTLSLQLKQFEENLGIPLFDRQHKKLILTEQGKVALDYARSIFKLGSEMREVLKDRIRPSRPSLTIAALDSIPKHVIVKLAKDALALQTCQITLIEGKSDELLRELSGHRADLLVTNYLPTALAAKGLFHRVVTRNQVSVYASPRYKSAMNDFPKSLSELPFILPTYDSKLRYDVDLWAQKENVRVDVFVESQDIAVKKMLAAQEMGVLPAAAHTVQVQVAAGELIELGTLHGVYEELILVTAERKIKNPLAQKLMQSFVV